MKRNHFATRAICILLSIAMITPIFAPRASAAQVNVQTLFLQYPQYLQNQTMKEGVNAADSACRAVLNSYASNNDTFLASLMTSLNNGLKVNFQNLLSKVGIGYSFYDENQMLATQQFLSDYLNCPVTLGKINDRLEKGYKVIKKVYDAGDKTETVVLENVLLEYAEAVQISISKSEVENYVKDFKKASKASMSMVSTRHMLPIIWEVNIAN